MGILPEGHGSISISHSATTSVVFLINDRRRINIFFKKVISLQRRISGAIYSSSAAARSSSGISKFTGDVFKLFQMSFLSFMKKKFNQGDTSGNNLRITGGYTLIAAGRTTRSRVCVCVGSCWDITTRLPADSTSMGTGTDISEM